MEVKYNRYSHFGIPESLTKINSFFSMPNAHLVFAISLLIMFQACIFGTAMRLIKTRSQMLNFGEEVLFIPAQNEQGPGIKFVYPIITKEDILEIASDRPPSIIDSVNGREHWIFHWRRSPYMRDKGIHLELYFDNGLLSELFVDPRFSELLGEDRIEMLARNFVGRKTKVSLKDRTIVCQVPAEELTPYFPLNINDMRLIFGSENYRRRNDKMKKNEFKMIFRYLLDGSSGKKAKMSFGVVINQDTRQMQRITSKIGSFRLQFDLSQQPQN
jgi:hypothetical protein